ncbi:MAG: GNAT family N-acetyltransferase [Chloroflexota bacterium]
MANIINQSSSADGLESVTTVEEIHNDYQHLTNCDPTQDMIVAEVYGEMVGYGRCTWEQELDGDRIYFHFARLLPAWRNEGIRRAILKFNESRLCAIAATHPNNGKQWLGGWAAETETHWQNLLLRHGYKPVRYFMEMVRPTLDDIPDLPLPAGIEVRRGTLEAWRQIWEAMREAFRDHWGHTEWPEEEFDSWSKEPNFDPSLWQIAWDGAEVAGGVLNYINQIENETYGRKRGYTEDIFVSRPWRRRGLAKALIARSFQVLKGEGMEEAALNVDAENVTGAVRLYTGLGFETVRQSAAYRKPL